MFCFPKLFTVAEPNTVEITLLSSPHVQMMWWECHSSYLFPASVNSDTRVSSLVKNHINSSYPRHWRHFKEKGDELKKVGCDSLTPGKLCSGKYLKIFPIFIPANSHTLRRRLKLIWGVVTKMRKRKRGENNRAKRRCKTPNLEKLKAIMWKKYF